MLGSLTGKVTARLDQRVLIEVSGVGYWVHTGSWQPTGDVTCFLHHHIREDANLLYGFADLPSLQLFEQLISVSGVGPKAALAVLSLGSTEKIQTAIKSGDSSFLSSAPGMGQKGAQKIIIELKGKLADHELAGASSTHQDVLAALESLGYKATDIRPLLAKIPSDLATLDEQIRWTLQNSK